MTSACQVQRVHCAWGWVVILHVQCSSSLLPAAVPTDWWCWLCEPATQLSLPAITVLSAQMVLRGGWFWVLCACYLIRLTNMVRTVRQTTGRCAHSDCSCMAACGATCSCCGCWLLTCSDSWGATQQVATGYACALPIMSDRELE